MSAGAPMTNQFTTPSAPGNALRGRTEGMVLAAVGEKERNAMTAEKPTLHLPAITIHSSGPRELARFYATLLQWELATDHPPRSGMPANAGWAQVKPPFGESGLTLNFEFERQYHRPVWPAELGGQNATQHLDIRISDGDPASAVAWAESCGARQMDVQPQEHVRVMSDPEGYPFCLFLPYRAAPESQA